MLRKRPVVDRKQAFANRPAATGAGRRRPARRPAGQASEAHQTDGELGGALGWSARQQDRGAQRSACGQGTANQLRAGRRDDGPARLGRTTAVLHVLVLDRRRLACPVQQVLEGLGASASGDDSYLSWRCRATEQAGRSRLQASSRTCCGRGRSVGPCRWSATTRRHPCRHMATTRTGQYKHTRPTRECRPGRLVMSGSVCRDMPAEP